MFCHVLQWFIRPERNGITVAGTTQFPRRRQNMIN